MHCIIKYRSNTFITQQGNLVLDYAAKTKSISSMELNSIQEIDSKLTKRHTTYSKNEK
mgnify:CR=1